MTSDQVESAGLDQLIYQETNNGLVVRDRGFYATSSSLNMQDVYLWDGRLSQRTESEQRSLCYLRYPDEKKAALIFRAAVQGSRRIEFFAHALIGGDDELTPERAIASFAWDWNGALWPDAPGVVIPDGDDLRTVPLKTYRSWASERGQELVAALPAPAASTPIRPSGSVGASPEKFAVIIDRNPPDLAVLLLAGLVREFGSTDFIGDGFATYEKLYIGKPTLPRLVFAWEPELGGQQLDRTLVDLRSMSMAEAIDELAAKVGGLAAVPKAPADKEKNDRERDHLKHADEGGENTQAGSDQAGSDQAASDTAADLEAADDGGEDPPGDDGKGADIATSGEDRSADDDAPTGEANDFDAATGTEGDREGARPQTGTADANGEAEGDHRDGQGSRTSLPGRDPVQNGRRARGDYIGARRRPEEYASHIQPDHEDEVRSVEGTRPDDFASRQHQSGQPETVPAPAVQMSDDAGVIQSLPLLHKRLEDLPRAANLLRSHAERREREAEARVRSQTELGEPPATSAYLLDAYDSQFMEHLIREARSQHFEPQLSDLFDALAHLLTADVSPAAGRRLDVSVQYLVPLIRMQIDSELQAKIARRIWQDGMIPYPIARLAGPDLLIARGFKVAPPDPPAAPDGPGPEQQRLQLTAGSAAVAIAALVLVCLVMLIIGAG